MEEYANKNSIAHIPAFILGLISIFSALFWYISLPCGTLAIILGAKSAKTTGSGLGKAGMALGIVGLVIFSFIYISLILLLLISNL